MKRSFWIKLSIILLIGTLCSCFFITWFFSTYQSHRLNHQSQVYLSEQLSLLHKHINTYLKKTITPSFSRIQNIISIYSKTPTESSLFLINKWGLFMAHSEAHYKATYLPKTSPLHSFIKKHPEGGGLVSQSNHFNSLINLARPITISSEKYFLIASHPANEPLSLFLSYFKWTLIFSIVSFCLLLLLMFFYLKPLIQAFSFLFHILGDKYSTETKKNFSYLAHTNNFYLKKMRSTLTIFFQKTNKKEKKDKLPQEVSFSDLIEKITHQSYLFFPHLQIQKELNANITLPLFSDLLFQSLWELIKNAAQAHATIYKTNDLKNSAYHKQKNTIIIRTYKKQNTWFCCEIEDKGPGMDRTIMEKANQLYFTTKKHASGLGLPFVQSALSRMGGIMKLRSQENKGLTVFLFIPLDYITHICNLKKTSQKRQKEEYITYPASEQVLNSSMV